jgi:hypothetical protein
MAERIEYRGDELPSGLPGVGGSSTFSLDLSGLSGFIRPLIFGPMVNAPTVTTPDPVAPVGSNPSVPTTTVVPPAAAPPATYVTNTTNTTTQQFTNITNINSICRDCRDETNVGSFPMLMGYRAETGFCYNCDGNLRNHTRYFSQPAAEGAGTGVYYGFNGQLYGSSFGQNQWFLSGEYLTLKNVTITPSSLKLGSNTFRPTQLQVCDNGTQTSITILSAS